MARSPPVSRITSVSAARTATRRRVAATVGHMADARCETGVCGGEAPPLVGSLLTGVGLTLAQAAARIERGERVALTDVQRRLVERWAQDRLAAR